MTSARRSLRILFLVSAHNSLSQRAYIAVTELGHDVEVAVVDSPPETDAAVRGHRPDLIVCPMLKRFIPESIWPSIAVAWSIRVPTAGRVPPRARRTAIVHRP